MFNVVVCEIITQQSCSSLLDQEISKLELTIKQQEKILKHRSIPNKHQPRSLPVVIDPQMHAAFLEDYKALYLKHLDLIIKANIIALNIKKARLQSSSIEVDTSHHQPQPSVSVPVPSRSRPSTTEKLPSATTTPQMLPQKRIQPNQNKQRKKQATLDHFLVKSHPKLMDIM